MNDRILGYTVIGFVILFLFFPIGFIIWKSSTPVITRTIAFEGVSSLSFISEMEPVLLKGVDVGVVKEVSIRDTTAIVLIETQKEIDLHDDYSITVVAKGVMGDRYLTISPGDNRKPIVPTGTLLHGKVNIGPDEALAYMVQLQSAVHTLVQISERLKNGTAQRESLIQQVKQFTTSIDSIIESMNSLCSGINSSFKRGIDSAVMILDQSITLTRKAGVMTPSALNSLESLMNSVDKILSKVEALTEKTDAVIGNIEDPDFLSWKKYHESITKNLSDLRRLFRVMQSDTLSLPVRIW